MMVPSSTSRVAEVGAVIVSYNGGEILGEVVERLVDQVGRIFIVDNASEPETVALLLSLRDRYADQITLIENAQNRGLATGLNQGVAACDDLGYEFVLMMDQDSRAAPGMVRGMVDAYRNNVGESIGLLSPNTSFVVDGNREHGADGDAQAQLREIAEAWTGGSLVPLEVFRRVGLHRDDLFIDYVDSELCYRIRKAGYRIVYVPWARMLQRRGDLREVRCFGRHICFFDNHAPIRYYYVARNGVILSREVRKVHLWEHLMVVANFAAKVVLFEDRKLAKLAMLTRGLRDGLAGMTGPFGSTTRSTG